MKTFEPILKRVRLAAAIVAGLALAACASAPATRWHTLLPSDLAAALPPGGAAPREPVAIVLAPIRVPVQVDQPQWVVRLADETLVVLEQERWASPLRDELRQALLAALAVRDAAIEAAGRSPARIGVDVRRFESLPGREARVEGAWTLQRGDAPATRCEFLYREQASSGMDALAAAHRRAVMRLAAAIGDGVRASVVCPATDPR